MTTEDHRPTAITVDILPHPAHALGSAEGVWVSLRGEADHSNLVQLQAGLSSIESDGIAVVHIGLAELSFCDAGAFRVLVDFAQDVEADGHAVFFHGANSVFRKMTALLAPPDTLKLR